MAYAAGGVGAVRGLDADECGIRRFSGYVALDRGTNDPSYWEASGLETHSEVWSCTKEGQ